MNQMAKPLSNDEIADLIAKDHHGSISVSTLARVFATLAEVAKLRELVDGRPTPANAIKAPVPDDAFEIPQAHIAAMTFNADKTPRAVRVRSVHLPGGDAWMPFACLHEHSEVYQNGDRGPLLVLRRFAEEKGWA